ncbi:LexA family protein [Lysinibacillus sp. UGB7]|uniref:LexA family protein n=1 Tax=Lysinibacillus sp. UGB7 TaxID=3411039 RepID=UPI003B817D1E
MDINVEKVLEEIVKRSGLEQDKFAESIGLKKAAFNNYIKGRRELPKEAIVRLMNQYNVNPQVFFDAKANLYLPKKKAINSPSSSLPLYGTVAAGALSEIEGVMEEEVEYINIPQRFLGKHRSCKNLFAMVVNGESMNKIITDGSVVIAKPLELDQYKENDIVIFNYNGEYSLKRFLPNTLEDHFMFASESTDNRFKNISIPKESLNNLKLCGKIIYYGNVL